MNSKKEDDNKCDPNTNGQLSDQPQIIDNTSSNTSNNTCSITVRSSNTKNPQIKRQRSNSSEAILFLDSQLETFLADNLSSILTGDNSNNDNTTSVISNSFLLSSSGVMSSSKKKKESKNKVQRMVLWNNPSSMLVNEYQVSTSIKVNGTQSTNKK
ncbi:hypothetical protein ABK040_003169 [Willaertia magna]